MRKAVLFLMAALTFFSLASSAKPFDPRAPINIRYSSSAVNPIVVDSMTPSSRVTNKTFRFHLDISTH